MQSSTIFILILLLLLLLSFQITAVHGDEESDFFIDCPPSRCNPGGPEVKYPLRLKSTSKSCGFPGLALSCSGNQTLLTLPSATLPSTFTVTAIDYTISLVTVKPLSPSYPCPLGNLSLIHSSYFAGTAFEISFLFISLLNCSQRFIPDDDDLVGPISCLSGADGFVYVANTGLSMDRLPLDCMAVTNGVTIPHLYKSLGSTNGVPIPYLYKSLVLGSTFRDSVDAFAVKRVLTFLWSTPGNVRCEDCEAKGRNCWFSRERNRTYCASSGHHGSHRRLIIGTSVGGVFVIISVAFISFYILRKSDADKEAHMKVEKFLAMYRTTNPTRYTYSDLKKITKRFRHKLGQGGFGSVYKGELPNGIPVAIKMLEKSRGEGEEFTNEVATIGRIHHVNVVRLLGFCSEGTRYALVYEFLPNESLEKFIFSKEPERHRLPLRMVKLQEIALGVARGIEYLHQGCDQRILHFDIKPHNILLDGDFNPKISDFGLAKLCSRDNSIVTMTAARGTLGYIAPELYSRNFGTVSYKSDVYSFGMLVFEMVGGRRTMDPTIENQGEIYFPEWVYNQLIDGQDLGLTIDMNEREEEIAKKLSIVALWCIQWSPVDRPSMTKVVEMLITDLSGLQLPPKPFVSSTDQDMGTSLNVVLNVNSTI